MFSWNQNTGDKAICHLYGKVAYMRFELFKIIDNQYVDDFLHGYLFMNTLNYFRGIEGNAAQGDPLEGICGSIPKTQLKQLGIYFDEDVVEAIQGNVSLISNYYGFNHLFCLYQLNIDDENKIVELPSNELCKFNDTGAASKVVDAIDKGLREHELEYGIYGSVFYNNSWINADGPGTRSAFYKESKYSYQKEWRLCLLKNALVDKPFKFYIGDLSDITEVIPLNEFLAEPEKLYEGYSSSSINLEVQNDNFHIFGTIDAVNHLMYAYMIPSTREYIRSDQAQADWHYSKYLQLTDSHQKIDPYLDACMKKYRDLDHMELLVEYRLSIGEWVKATDAFMFFLNEVPESISQNPVRFFFPLHSILMQHKKPSDAGKLYMLATNKYGLPDETKLVMQSDVLLGLGFYDQTLPLLHQMKETYSDPILDYYLAVSYLHVLEFEKSHQYLSIYEQYFSHSPQNANNISRLRTIINCLFNEEQLQYDEYSAAFPQIEWDPQWERMLTETQTTEVFLGVDILYGIEKTKKWKLLDKFKKIIVCPLTIAEMINIYTQSGDPTLFNIIINLSYYPHLEVKSPELKYYLALDISQNDVPSFIKMEQALQLQETQQNE